MNKEAKPVIVEICGGGLDWIGWNYSVCFWLKADVEGKWEWRNCLYLQKGRFLQNYYTVKVERLKKNRIGREKEDLGIILIWLTVCLNSFWRLGMKFIKTPDARSCPKFASELMRVRPRYFGQWSLSQSSRSFCIFSLPRYKYVRDRYGWHMILPKYCSWMVTFTNCNLLKY